MLRVRFIASLIAGALLTVSVPALAGGPATLEEAKTMAVEQNKPILIDFWAVWCGPCKAFNRDMKEDAEVQEATAQFILFKTDAEKEGKELAEEYSVSGYPTYVVLNTKGETLSRWAGYDKELHLEQTAMVLADPTTIEEKFARFEKNPTAKDATKLAVYYDSRGEAREAVDYYGRAEKLDPDTNHTWDIYYATYNGNHDKIYTFDELLAASETFFNSPRAGDYYLLVGVRMLSSAAARAGRPDAVTPYLKIAVEKTEGSTDEAAVKYRTQVLPSHALLVEKNAEKAVAYKKDSLGEGWMDSPGALNSFAWWCFENNINLQEAYEMAKRGVDLSEPGPDRAMILDTQAEICNAMDDCQQAVDLIRLAIKNDPNREAYKKQEKRFLELLAAKNGDKM